MQANDLDLIIHLLGEPCYEANCTFAVAHGSVATPWNRQKIAPAFSAYSPSMDINNFPRRGALPCTTASAHFTLSN